ncbi:DUF2190 family protein [Kaistia sp. MMO-174]|uniref:DUF2190 family protein n=1 Tax=Kaistia sp. MMO-174 TaxID=3081256 RepID=UPI00301B244B
MKNFVQPGDMLTLTAPYDVASGGGILVGSIFGIAAFSALSGAGVEAKTTGVFDLTAEGAASGQAFAVGDAVYWDNTAKRATKTSASNTKIGVATAAKASTDVVARVRLNGAF